MGLLLAEMFLSGPGGIHADSSEQQIEAISALGIVLLLFGLDLEFQKWHKPCDQIGSMGKGVAWNEQIKLAPDNA